MAVRQSLGGVCAVAVILAATNAFADDAPAFDADTLVELPRDNWITAGGNVYNQRYSPLTSLNRDNVARLKGVWRARLDGSGAGPQHSGEAQPIVYDGVIYLVTGANDVFAIDVASGERLWKYQAHLDPDISTICCGWTSRGVAIGDGMVFVGQLDGRLVALNQADGSIRWSVQAERWQDGYTITSAPLYIEGLVITGFAGAEYGVRGRVKAYDATNGELRWTFYSTPAPGEPGFESWPQDSDAWMNGGGAVWNTPAADPELGLIYYQTANAGPDFDGAVREGDNLYTSSILAVEIETGKLAWYFQTVHHDIWDYDGANPVVLFDTEIDGRMRKGLGAAGKTSWVYLLDRTNGEPLVGIVERPVPQEPRQRTASTQPYPVGDSITPQRIDIAPDGYRLINSGQIFTPFYDEPVVMKPGALGGINWPPSSYDPETATMYVCANDRIHAYKREAVDGHEPGDPYYGGPMMRTSLPAVGIFAALDVTTNRIRWRQQWGSTCYSGSTVTAGGLVFVGRNDGRLMALDSSNGSWLWEFQTGAGVNATASVFEHDGKPYVAVYSAGNLFARSAKGDSLWLFGLDGTLDPVQPGLVGGGMNHESVFRSGCRRGGPGRGTGKVRTDLRLLPLVHWRGRS